MTFFLHNFIWEIRGNICYYLNVSLSSVLYETASVCSSLTIALFIPCRCLLFCSDFLSKISRQRRPDRSDLVPSAFAIFSNLFFFLQRTCSEHIASIDPTISRNIGNQIQSTKVFSYLWCFSFVCPVDSFYGCWCCIQYRPCSHVLISSIPLCSMCVYWQYIGDRELSFCDK